MGSSEEPAVRGRARRGAQALPGSQGTAQVSRLIRATLREGRIHMSEEARRGGAQRIAVVTGGARGIGAAVAKRFAADGMAVAVIDLKESDCASTVEANTGAGGRAFATSADVSDSAEVSAAVEAIAAELGPPTVLVNNAGVIRDNLLFKMTDDDFDTVIGVHLRGAFLMARACQKYMVEASYGRIISLSSSSALGNRGQTNYS